MRIAVLSDTHSPRFWKRCPPAVATALEGVDLVLHAGDVCLRATLEELEQFAPVRAVRGNNDGPDVAAWGRPRRSASSSRGCGWRWCTTAARSPVGGRGCGGCSRTPSWSCSGTRT